MKWTSSSPSSEKVSGAPDAGVATNRRPDRLAEGRGASGGTGERAAPRPASRSYALARCALLTTFGDRSARR
jgi:hypothetical protein